MYCGSCLHDNTLAAALLELGEDVLLVPTYTPLRTDETDVSIRRIFFGGINVYLQQKSAVFRHTPWWFDRVLDHPALLEMVSRSAGSVDPDATGRHDGLDAPRRGGPAAEGSRKARRLAGDRSAARRRPPFELDAARHGPDAPRARPRAGRMPTFWRGHLSRKAPPAVLRRGPRDACASGRPTSTPSSPSIATTPISWPTIWRSTAHEST